MPLVERHYCLGSSQNLPGRKFLKVSGQRKKLSQYKITSS